MPSAKDDFWLAWEKKQVNEEEGWKEMEQDVVVLNSGAHWSERTLGVEQRLVPKAFRAMVSRVSLSLSFFLSSFIAEFVFFAFPGGLSSLPLPLPTKYPPRRSLDQYSSPRLRDLHLPWHSRSGRGGFASDLGMEHFRGTR